MQDYEKLNFTVGPVMASAQTLQVRGRQTPYFRTSGFSAVMLENERLVKKFMDAPEGSRAVFLTGSGTASMEASVMNCLTSRDKALVVNGGSFGQRFCQLCEVHQIPYTQIALAPGHTLTSQDLAPYEKEQYTAFLVNLCETSTGVLYDLPMIHEFCSRNGLFLIVDAVSAFLADELSMVDMGVDVAITGSQKALAANPGISIMTFSPRALARIQENPVQSLYFDLKHYLTDGNRGQTPFTPAVATLLEIHQRLCQIEQIGVQEECRRVAALARDFRTRIAHLPLRLFPDRASNAVTALEVFGNMTAHGIFEHLSENYGIFVCPNGGDLRDRVFRVGHIGCLTMDDNSRLIAALDEMNQKGIL